MGKVGVSDLDRVLEISAVLPPVLDTFNVIPCMESEREDSKPIGNEPQPITAFVCIIAYEDRQGALTERLITCQRYDLIGGIGYVGAICHASRGYRQFRTDRIACVSDPRTGETLGQGTFFSQFSTDAMATGVYSWGLDRKKKAHLIAGLNVLAFMARCDGYWHPLEEEVIVQFTCSLWLRSEWDGEPPMDQVIAHARRIAPDGEAFFKALLQYSRNRTSTAVLKQGVSALIAADGVICDEEHRWTMAMLEYLNTPDVLEEYAAHR